MTEYELAAPPSRPRPAGSGRPPKWPQRATIAREHAGQWVRFRHDGKSAPNKHQIAKAAGPGIEVTTRRDDDGGFSVYLRAEVTR